MKPIRIRVAFHKPDNMIMALEDVRGMEASLVQQAASMAYAEWDRLAREELKTSSGDYARALVKPEISGRRATLMLEGWLPNAVENGIDGYSLYATLLGPSAKNRKPIMGKHGEIKGYYNTVPFRHGTPGVTGRNFTEVGNQYLAHSDISRRFAHTVMTEDEVIRRRESVYSVMKQLDDTPNVSEVDNRPDRLPPGLFPLLRQQHTVDIFAGMQKSSAAYDKTIGSHYVTFRRISTLDSAEDRWKHPGIEARNFAPRVQEFLREHSADMLTSSLLAGQIGLED